MDLGFVYVKISKQSLVSKKWFTLQDQPVNPRTCALVKIYLKIYEHFDNAHDLRMLFKVLKLECRMCKGITIKELQIKLQ